MQRTVGGAAPVAGRVSDSAPLPRQQQGEQAIRSRTRDLLPGGFLRRITQAGKAMRELYDSISLCVSAQPAVSSSVSCCAQHRHNPRESAPCNCPMYEGGFERR
eukprot:235196-Chlamydomonas_euryale.AAC.2